MNSIVPADRDSSRVVPDHLQEIAEKVLWLSTSIIHHATAYARTPADSRSEATRPPAPRWSRS